MFVLAYAGFFRNKEISNIKMNKLSFFDTHVIICIESSIRQSYDNVLITRLDKYQYLFLR
jgi:hypothetical protein